MNPHASRQHVLLRPLSYLTALAAAALLVAAVISATTARAQSPDWDGDIPGSGVALLTWNGGTLEDLVGSAEANGFRSLFATSGGEFLGHIVGAPDFVNADLAALFAGEVPAGTPFVVLVGSDATPAATPYATDSTDAAFATVEPGGIGGLATETRSQMAPPFQYFASWPVISGYPPLGEEAATVIESWRATFAERVGEPVPGSPIVPELNITFDFLVASGDVIGVRLQRFEFLGAGGANFARSLWFDTADSSLLPATALLDGPGALEQVAEMAREALMRDRPDLSLPDLLEDGTAPTEENYDTIGFTTGGDLLIEFDEYQVGPGASGSPRVVIPAAIAEPLLSDLGRRARQQVLDPGGELAAPTPVPTPTPEVAQPPDGGVNCAQVACVALTFDDGPARPTLRLLDILSERGVQATFFVLGVNVAHNDEVLARMVAAGHEVGNHTFDHRDLTKLSAEEIREQVDGAGAAIQAATGQWPRLLRPPYGAIDARVAEVTGMPFILWSVDPRDWADHDAALVAGRVAAEARRGSIVLLHDIHETSVDAVPAILDGFASRGLTAVTVSELLGPELVPGHTYRGS